MDKDNKNQSKLEQWRTKYASFVVTLWCLYSLIFTWGEGWIFSTIMAFGVIICGAFAISDFKKRKSE